MKARRLAASVAASALMAGGLTVALATPAQALQVATRDAAKVARVDADRGSVSAGKRSDLILVDGDVSQDLGNLRHVGTVFLDGYRLNAQALRQASGLSGMPK